MDEILVKGKRCLKHIISPSCTYTKGRIMMPRLQAKQRNAV